MRPSLLALLASGLAAAACGVPAPHAPTGCNPLGDPSTCLLPWPSSYFLEEDDSTATGYRVSLPKSAMPKSDPGIRLDPAPYRRVDGFSPSTPILFFFPTRADLSGVASVKDFAPSLSADSPIQVFNYATGERVIFFAEIDANADPSQRQAVIVRPQRRLDAASRYVVAVRHSLKDLQGNPVASPPAFAELRDAGAAPGTPLYSLRGRMAEVFAFLERQGISRQDLAVAFDFVTASESTRTGALVAMRDEVLARATWNYRVTRVEDTPADPNLMRKVFGTFEVPSFLTTDDVKGVIRWGEDGRPQYRAMQSFPFVVHVPKCAATATGPLPLMVYGHGLFGCAYCEMASGYQKQLIDRLCMVQLGTNWIGLSEDDETENVVKEVLPDFNRLILVTERLMQAHVNTVALARLAKNHFKDMPELVVAGKPAVDGKEIYYFGISNGGVQGTGFMALSPDVERGVLNVPGGEWSLMIHRSSNFAGLQVVMDLFYPDKVDQQLLIAMSQTLWDYTDPASYGPHLLKDPLPGSPIKRVLYQEAIGDAQVPNLATRVMVRAIGLPVLAPAVQKVPLVEELPGPLTSAYVQYDVHPSPLPSDTNVPPSSDNQAHGAVRRLEACMAQIQAFLKPGGKITQTCQGACDPE